MDSLCEKAIQNIAIDWMVIDKLYVTSLLERTLKGVDDLYQVMQHLNKLALQKKVRVIAKGIDTSEQLEIITRMGCTIAQGSLIAKPIPLEALKEGMVNLDKQFYSQTRNTHK